MEQLLSGIECLKESEPTGEAIELHELKELQLALVGGGIGDVYPG